MNDRELLELAALAAGYELLPCSCSQGAFKTVHVKADPTHWNPLRDDGDALRLAVGLGLLVYVFPDAGFSAIRLPGEQLGGKYDLVQNHDGDPYAATRRAIVRAAADIGRGM